MPDTEYGNTALALERLANRIEALLEKQEEIAEDISQIKAAVYDPDKGIFARVKLLENSIVENGPIRVTQIEDTLDSMKKIQWMIIGSAIATGTAILVKAFLE